MSVVFPKIPERAPQGDIKAEGWQGKRQSAVACEHSEESQGLTCGFSEEVVHVMAVPCSSQESGGFHRGGISSSFRNWQGVNTNGVFVA